MLKEEEQMKTKKYVGRDLIESDLRWVGVIEEDVGSENGRLGWLTSSS